MAKVQDERVSEMQRSILRHPHELVAIRDDEGECRCGEIFYGAPYDIRIQMSIHREATTG